VVAAAYFVERPAVNLAVSCIAGCRPCVTIGCILVWLGYPFSFHASIT
jgi:hypothetical protein